MSRTHPYAGQPVGLATKHAKQHVIGSALARMPGLQVVVPERLDTDLLGTFTGEIERPAPPRETALLKARLGLRATGLSRALSSEGAFGDPDVVGDVAQARCGIAHDAEQHVRVVGEERPVRHG